jgi:hypothetical protein
MIILKTNHHILLHYGYVCVIHTLASCEVYVLATEIVGYHIN